MHCAQSLALSQVDSMLEQHALQVRRQHASPPSWLRSAVWLKITRVNPGSVKGATLEWEDPNSDLQLQRRAHLVWDEGGPKTAFNVKKSGSARTSKALKDIATW